MNGPFNLDALMKQFAAEVATQVISAIVTMQKVEDDPLLDTRAAAKYLGCSTQLLVLQRHRGDGPVFVRVGRLCKYRRSSLDGYLSEHEHRNTNYKEGAAQ
jgi:hypothetical protein